MKKEHIYRNQELSRGGHIQNVSPGTITHFHFFFFLFLLVEGTTGLILFSSMLAGIER